MKKITTAILGMLAIAIITHLNSQEPAAQKAALPVSGISWSVDFSGEPNQSDIRAAKMVVTNENVRRTGAAEPKLPMDTPEELNASYIFVMKNAIETTHAMYILQEAEVSKPANMQEWWRNATDEQREAVKAMTKGDPPEQP